LGYDFISRLSFSKNWGLGSSSTLINNLADWAKVDPYELLKLTFGGSGYDIACAKHNNPIQFSNLNNKISVKEVSFDPVFKENIFFIYLGKKQNSRNGIQKYRSKKNDITNNIRNEFTNINRSILKTKDIKEFEKNLTKHEQLISNLVGLNTVKDELFNDYSKGAIKSLGAWGGDFVLATGTKEDMQYFLKKDYKIIFEYSQLIK
jgi:mevalonate kinase